MKVLCAFGQYQYGDQSRGIGIEYEAFIPALRRLGHEVRHFETWDSSLYPTYSRLNHALLAEIEEFHPEIVLTVQRDCEIWTETLEAIQHRGDAALVTWTTDDSFKFHKVSKYIGRYYDAISTTYDYRVPDYKSAGIDGVYLTQWAANAHWLNPPLPAQVCQYSVSFIGASYGARAELIKKLETKGIHVECFGFGWPNGSVSTEQIPIIMRNSVISLNFSAGFSSDEGNARQIKARTFEVPGAGGFLLTDGAPGMDEVYRLGQEIEVYNGFDELEQKIKYYLQRPDERDRIAHGGYLRTRNCHTYERRLEGILRFALERRTLRIQEQAHVAVGGKDAVAKTLPSPRLGVTLRGLRWMLVSACRLVWGTRRGPKAARRLVFEVSRKVFGIRTFSGESIPGRMFPYV
jgi:spore maturation protein CgeB